ncbi:MAG: type I methionyl aminopeptidase [Clostridiales bacterium]|jgi:methionyl aminopeptidase|nr:type I methionyl aminopeptidase [Clostridiales bacterium]
MISLKNAAQVDKMRAAGRLLHDVLQRLREVIRPGESTGALDAFAEELIRRNGAVPSFLNYRGYPSSICASVDDEVVHGIPSERQILKEGSILSVDCGLILDGWHADSAFTVGIGTIAPELEKLIQVTQDCFFQGVRQAVAGVRIGDVGHAVQSLAEGYGYGVIRDLTGHGIGRSMHEDPSVPNFGDSGQGVRLKAGMTIAVEPMISLGSWQVKEMDDGWTIKTVDGSPCAHYEHTILVREDGLPEILTLPDHSWT